MKITSLLAFSLLLAALPAHAQMNYQGRLTGPQGAALADGQYTLEFSIWDAATGGTQVWGPYTTDGGTTAGKGPRADLIAGNFNVIIGNNDSASRLLSDALVGASNRFLQIKVGTNSPITPRQQILAAPRALVADSVANLKPIPSGVNITPYPGSLNIGGTGDNWSVIKAEEGVLTINQGNWEKVGIPYGMVGIGTTAPAGKLNILEDSGTVHGPNSGSLVLDHDNSGGASSIVFRSKANRGGDYGYIQYQDAATVSGTGESARLILGTSNEADDHIALMPSGNVGIGTTSPTQAKLAVIGGVDNNPEAAGTKYNYLDDVNSNTVHHSSGGTQEVTGIYADKAIWSGTYIICSSDERIKTIRGQSDSAADLQTVRALQITDYNYKDTVANSGRMQKKLIAQQVEKVYPQSVNRNTNVVPDIYQKAAFQDGWVALKTDLKQGDRVRLLDDKKGDGICEVLEVKDGAFRTDFKPAGDQVFVYGREVNDFRTVDYDAIAMLNVSATQELARQLDAERAAVLTLQKANATLEAENAALKGALAENTSKDKAQDAQLAALAKLLENRAPSAAVTTMSTRR